MSFPNSGCVDVHGIAKWKPCKMRAIIYVAVMVIYPLAIVGKKHQPVQTTS